MASPEKKVNQLDRLRKAAGLAGTRQKLYDKIQEVQAHIARLVPLKYLVKLLLAGDISSELFLQRMIDSGYNLHDALNEFNKIRHGEGGENVQQLKDGSILANPTPYMKPIKRARIADTRETTHQSMPPPSIDQICSGCFPGGQWGTGINPERNGEEGSVAPTPAVASDAIWNLYVYDAYGATKEGPYNVNDLNKKLEEYKSKGIKVSVSNA